MKTKPAGLFLLFLFSVQLSAFAYYVPNVVNEKLVKAFRDAFPGAEKVVWKEKNDHYFVHFKDHDIVSAIEYDYDGNFLSSERYYKSGDLLPLQLAWEIRKKYPDKTVFGITETNNGSDILYYIKLEGAKTWMTVKGSSDGIIQVIDRFNKQD